MKLYMAMTNDKYELPVAVAEKKSELARMMGRELSVVVNSLRRSKTVKNPTGKYKWAEVEVEEVEDEE